MFEIIHSLAERSSFGVAIAKALLYAPIVAMVLLSVFDRNRLRIIITALTIWLGCTLLYGFSVSGQGHIGVSRTLLISAIVFIPLAAVCLLFNMLFKDKALDDNFSQDHSDKK